VSLFEQSSMGPLALRMRPRSFEELVGQERALTLGSPLQRLLTGSGSVSIILWGPPGTGKTTIATLISTQTGRKFRELSAVSAGVRDVREVIEKAREDSSLYGTETVLFIDEVHRFNKAQQDALLPAVENGWVTLVAATTENPSFSVVSPLLSRSVVVKLELLDQASLRTLLIRAMESERGLGATLTATDAAMQALIDASSGDARRALTALESAANATLARSSEEISVADVENAINIVAINYDKDGDTHYDVVSAFIKSVRGSDPDAALHYLARMLHAGEDPRFIARRLMILASEDIGLAASQVLLTAVAAAQSVQLVGMPEAQIILAHATLEAALAPKSNSVVAAIGAAMSDVQRGRVGSVPLHLRDSHYPGASQLGHGASYIYPHDESGGVAQQSYLPEELEDASYYRPSPHGAEPRLGAVADRLRKLRNGESLD
jgi:putative ATPase